MNIDHSKYSTFKEYLDDMPFGTLQWITDRSGLAKLTIIRIAAGSKLQQDTLDILMNITGLSAKCFGEVNASRSMKAGRRIVSLTK